MEGFSLTGCRKSLHTPLTLTALNEEPSQTKYTVRKQITHKTSKETTPRQQYKLEQEQTEKDNLTELQERKGDHKITGRRPSQVKRKMPAKTLKNTTHLMQAMKAVSKRQSISPTNLELNSSPRAEWKEQKTVETQETNQLARLLARKLSLQSLHRLMKTTTKEKKTMFGLDDDSVVQFLSAIQTKKAIIESKAEEKEHGQTVQGVRSTPGEQLSNLQNIYDKLHDSERENLVANLSLLNSARTATSESEIQDSTAENKEHLTEEGSVSTKTGPGNEQRSSMRTSSSTFTPDGESPRILQLFEKGLLPLSRDNEDPSFKGKHRSKGNEVQNSTRTSMSSFSNSLEQESGFAAFSQSTTQSRKSKPKRGAVAEEHPKENLHKELSLDPSSGGLLVAASGFNKHVPTKRGPLQKIKELFEEGRFAEAETEIEEQDFGTLFPELQAQAMKGSLIEFDTDIKALSQTQQRLVSNIELVHQLSNEITHVMDRNSHRIQLATSLITTMVKKLENYQRLAEEQSALPVVLNKATSKVIGVLKAQRELLLRGGKQRGTIRIDA